MTHNVSQFMKMSTLERNNRGVSLSTKNRGKMSVDKFKCFDHCRLHPNLVKRTEVSSTSIGDLR